MGHPPPAVGQILKLQIDRLAYHSGHGVARANGFVVFVPFTAPLDIVEAEVTEFHRTYATARLVRILEAGPSRRQPPCPVVGRCGGCQWQQVSYDEQVRQKDRLLKESLRGLARFGDVNFRPLLEAPEEFRYRNRVQVHRHGRDVGFYAAGSHELVGVTDCWLAEPAVAKAFANVRERANAQGAADEERVEIARRTDGEIEITTATGEGAAGRFAQVNSRQNEILIESVRSAVAGRKFSRVIDLFCGSGNLTFPLAEEIPDVEVDGVELSGHLIKLAKNASAKHSEGTRLNWHAQATASYLKSLKPDHEALVVLDPPRPGCDRMTRDAITRIRPKQIVYVSCNPSTLSRDLEPWLNTGAYQIDFVQGLDMFPQTAHLEAVVAMSTVLC